MIKTVDFDTDKYTAGIGPEGFFTRWHNQVDIELDGKTAIVDWKMAPFILKLWSAGIDTAFSCQGGRYDFDENRYCSSGYLALAKGADIWQAARVLNWGIGDFVADTRGSIAYGDTFRFFDIDRLPRAKNG